ncbi:hypothetical protein Sru01_09910 [Sphaerisporangium rufum]|uniref:Uncharacterized protein n=1 Tax=Sphaerisporangium rufum TaxID=1381558 RepID=A0A919QXQ2_9ACTN|nr:hypothetical protein [Sphaerisporangium rufum]GII76009.1 hypothetical protein Sru01_09910 [Sphaerisporangium rufum]
MLRSWPDSQWPAGRSPAGRPPAPYPYLEDTMAAKRSLLHELINVVSKLSSEIVGRPTSPGPVVDPERHPHPVNRPRRPR